MAKAKKGKSEEQRDGDNSNTEAVVKHQKLCLCIDMENRRIYGYTEMQIVIPDNGIVGLHADNLAIEKVTVDGEPAEFEVFPHYQHLDPKDRWCVVSSATSAADASGSVYLSSLELELLPNLLIMCSKSSKPDNQQQACLDMENGEQLSADTSRLCLVQNVKNVRIDYWVEKAETGIHFDNSILHTDNQLRRARCWFPCMDESLQYCCYDLEFTVAGNLVAVSSGTLLHQVLTKDDPPQKTYVYKIDVPIAAQWISLTVAPFEILPDQHRGLLSYFCLPDNMSKLRNTVVFFYNAFSHYEDYLSKSFPFRSYSQVFIPPETAVSSWSLGASISIFSSHVLFDEKIIDQTIETWIKLAYALARQWFGVYITPEAPNDEWLLDGLAGFLSDSFIKAFLGNNEVRYRRYKANCAVCQADDSGATALSSSLASKDLYGTQCIGFYRKIRSWKSVAVLQMLEQQMGPESFRKILQNIILRARDSNRPLRTLSTKEFRHFANKIGNLERPFLKEFFPRWVGSCGCPVLKMGFSFNKRKNMVELAVQRGCTSWPDSSAVVDNINPDSGKQESNVGWPGMMSIRVHELDGMYDHPILPMAGEPCQLFEIQCHSKLVAKRYQKPKKGSKADGSDDNGDAGTTTDVRLNSDSTLLWLRADPEMEYLAEVHFNQPVQMWINQLEKDKDVIAQAQAIAVLEALPQLSFSVVNALNNSLSDSKAFWRVRIQAAYALATTTCEDTDWAGLLHLIKFYKSRRFDPISGLPRPNDFHDFPEYFVLEAIPHAIALVRSSDKRSPREAVDFILQLLKLNDNNRNTYSDVFWLANLVRSVGELEFGQQSIVHLPSLLKRLDRLLQFDRLMPSHNGILTISCIQSLTQIAVKLADFIPLDRFVEFIKPYRGSKTVQIRVGATRALLELEFQSKGIDAMLILFIRYLYEEMSLRGQTKLGVCALRLSQLTSWSECENDIKSETLVALLRLLESPLAFNNVTLRHYIFCILQVLAGRSPTLFGVPRDETLMMGHTRTSTELKNIFAALINQSKPQDPAASLVSDHAAPDNLLVSEVDKEIDAPTENQELNKTPTSPAPDKLPILDTKTETIAHEMNFLSLLPQDDAIALANVNIIPESNEQMEQLTKALDDNISNPEPSRETDGVYTIDPESGLVFDPMVIEKATKEPDTVLDIRELPKKTKLKIRVKQQPAPSTRAENPDNSRISNQNIEDANSSHDVGSRVTAGIGSAKLVTEGDDLVKELQCTADSSKITFSLPSEAVNIEIEPQTSEHMRIDATEKVDPGGEIKEKKKDKEKKRKKNVHNDDSEKREIKRQKKEKKRKEKEMAKILADKSNKTILVDLPSHEEGVANVNQEVGPSSLGLESKELLPESSARPGNMSVQLEPVESTREIAVVNRIDGSVNLPQSTTTTTTSHKIKIKFKNRTLGKP